MSVTIDVTQEDIDHGEARNCDACPIARAATRAFGKTIWVGSTLLGTYSENHLTDTSVELPVVAMDFIHNFDDEDNRSECGPFSFSVSDPSTWRQL